MNTNFEMGGATYAQDQAEDEREKSIKELEIIKNWFLKRWISYSEYLKLMDLIF